MLYRKADKLDELIKRNNQEIMTKYGLNWQQAINLYVLEEVMYSDKVVIESNDLDEIAEKMIKKIEGI